MNKLTEQEKSFLYDYMVKYYNEIKENAGFHEPLWRYGEIANLMREVITEPQSLLPNTFNYEN